MDGSDRDKKVQDFIKYVTRHVKSIGIEPYGTGIVTEAQFADDIHRYLGESCSFCMTASSFYFTSDRICIINRDSHREVLHIDGTMGGDVYGGMDICFCPQIFFYGNNVFYKGKNVGTIGDDRKYDFDRRTGALYLITSHSLKKIDSRGSTAWESPLNRNTQCAVLKRFLRPTADYTDEKMVQVIIDDNLVMVYRDADGVLYDTLYLRRCSY